MPILYLWTDLIQDEAKNILDATECIDLDCVHLESGISGKQNNVSKECLNEVRYREIEAFAERAEEEDFRRGFFECEVCFESRSGDDCVKFYPCGHIFCKQCVTAFYRHQLKELSIKRLECLDQKCESLASEKQLKTVLTDDEIEWYEKILLFNGLDTMQDVVICPRMSCGAHVLLDEDQAKGSSL
ncbi:unnamed protein product [Anisakis simplex]|uniref:E3 ubiquitin-protein ligase RNF14 (inferred by orthology to a human protein) n=1 Tax=Anisakis simplex TaxID=6269 RepID=A0A0M3JAA1_ANISI|nr:unnamed protein product [Anisakis simplex]